jgi:hypothetical protein
MSVRGLFLRMRGLTCGGGMLVVTGSGTMGGGTVGFVELFSAIGAFKIMTLARHGRHGNSHKQDGE